MPFQPLTQEPEIQRRWLESGAFRAKRASELLPGSRTFYMLVMLPYPSGRIHMGHVRNYTLGDVTARFRRMRGYEVMHPLGWDSFGLPAENAAIKNGIHPAIWTRANIQEMKGQIQKMGISYDWDREIATCLPEYYRWNQWFFLKMWERGDVFRAMRNVNWCEALGTVLANEQVVDGKDERTGHPVVQKQLEQYFFAITKFAEELLAGHAQLDWPENVKAMQRHWIGKSEGARLTFDLTSGEKVQVFTTRLDTLFGVSFLALSTEHPFIKAAAETDPALKGFCDQVAAMSREDRLMSDIKLGFRSKLEAVHPFTGEKVPIFAANYVLMDYGTGAVMGVPAHDERDFEFAEKYGIPIPKVIESENPWEPGILVNSGEFTGLTSEAATDAMVAKLAGGAAKAITYKLKDWGLSRQRYWGTPIPTVHCPDCGVVPEKAENLPIRLPEDVAFAGAGASPLLTSRTFLDCPCPKCGAPARRETDTMDTFVDSSWYWMRYLDPKNDRMPFAKAEADAWSPVDLYIGGIEHATMHLIYARYFYKVMRDLGLVSGDEPFKKLICQGMVLKDGFKMSKSKGNIVDPWKMFEKFGADAVRFYLFTVNQPGDYKRFDEHDVDGIVKKVFLILWNTMEFWKLSQITTKNQEPISSPEHILDKWLRSRLNQLVKNVTENLDAYRPTDAGRAVMEFVNELSTWYVRRSRDRFRAGASVEPLYEALMTVTKLLAPMTPFVAEAMYAELAGEGESVHLVDWPKFNDKEIDDDLIAEMATIRKIVELGHALRDEAEVKLRQPLSEVEIEKAALKNIDELLPLAAEELNVKLVRSIDRIDERGGWIIKSANGLTVALRTEITAELKREGMMREIMRQINDLRKEAKLTPADRITLMFDIDDIEFKSILTTEKEHLAASARADEVVMERGEVAVSRELDIDDKKLWIGVKKI